MATYLDLLKICNAQFRLGSSFEQAQQAAKINEVQQYIRWNSGDPTLWDIPTGQVLSTAQTGSVPSTASADYGLFFFKNGGLLRITTTIGATPTCTYGIQGSVDGSTNWTQLSYADYLTPGTIVSSTFVITTATTALKLIPAGQLYRYLRLNYTANTNVTNTADLTIF